MNSKEKSNKKAKRKGKAAKWQWYQHANVKDHTLPNKQLKKKVLNLRIEFALLAVADYAL